ncbi:MAG TPA: 50S ribosomal protein L18, partial [Alphaproteobacteria bacterium]|nr:50S ribosomal protein L18 [Alphaproteobacteria bacterium]
RRKKEINNMQKKIENINRRKLRNRFKVKKFSVGVPRLSVFRSARHIFGQIIDDTVGKTLVQASTLEQDL